MEKENEVLEDIEDFEDTEELEDDSMEDDSEVEETDSEESEENEEESKEQEDEKPQKELSRKEQNRINAERRRNEKAKREKQLLQEGYNNALKEEIGGVNPYTNKQIKDDVDMQIYLDMRKLDKEGKDPISDYADYIAEKQRSLAQEQKAQQEIQSKASDDFNAFTKKYPNVDAQKLFNDKHFGKFAKGKMGNMPLSEIYEDFIGFEQEFEDKSEQEANDKVAKKYARVQSSIGSLQNVGKTERKSIREMSDEEFMELKEKVNRGYNI